MDPEDPRPPFRQLAAILRESIEEGEWAVGERIPSLNELAARFSLSPATVQQALKPLKEDGLLSSRAGSGVFVQAKEARGDLLGHLQSELDRRPGGRIVYYVGRTGEPLVELLGSLDVAEARTRQKPMVITALLTDPMEGLAEAIEEVSEGACSLQLKTNFDAPAWVAVQVGRFNFFLSLADEAALLDPEKVIDLKVWPKCDPFKRLKVQEGSDSARRK